MTSHMSKNGGNALGLDPSEGPLLLLNLSFMWANAADDDAIMAVLGSITAKSITEAKSRGLYHEYLYINYASQYQDVVQSHGAANHERLQPLHANMIPTRCFRNSGRDISSLTKLLALPIHRASEYGRATCNYSRMRNNCIKKPVYT